MTGTPQIPSGWIHTTLDEVCIANQAGAWGKPVGLSDASTYPVVRNGDIGSDGKIRASLPLRGLSRSEAAKALLQAGDVLITTSGDVGKTALWRDGSVCAASNFVRVLRPAYDISSEYCYYFLRARSTQARLGEAARGVAIKNLPSGVIGNLLFPLPPLAEQRRIVEEIEQQFTRLDAAVEALRAAQAKLKRYRASVLNAAVTGRLVPTEAALARAEGRDYEHASVLLERIARERAEQERGKPRRKRPALAPVDTSNLPELPEGWAWSNVNDLIIEPLSNGRSVGKADEGFPVLRLTALRDGKIDQGEYRAGAWTAKLGKRFSIREGDFFVSRGNGSINLVGRGGLAGPVVTPVAYPDTMIRVRLHGAVIGAFFTQAWNSSTVRSQVEPKAKTTAGIYKINQQDLLRFVVPIPPTLEQQRVAVEVERRLSGVRQAEAAVEANLKRAERLRQAILKRAFEGRLVPQDPDDEPASVLLERIKTEKAAAERERRRRGRVKR